MASLGLPGLAGFVSEFLCFLGAFQEPQTRIYAIISVLGILVTAGFFLWMIQRIFLGPLNPKYAQLEEISTREILAIAPLTFIMILLGVYPRLLTDLMDPTLTQLIGLVKHGGF